MKTNFVKYQLEINKILIDYSKQINTKEIKEIVHTPDNVLFIQEMIKRYISYYTFITVGFFYKGKDETFVNNIIEFSKNQPTFQFKVNNFFNSEANSNIIKYKSLSRNIKTLVDSEPSKIAMLVKKTGILKSS